MAAPKRPKRQFKKVAVAIRIDPDVIAFFKAGGPGYQSRMHEALRSIVRSQAVQQAA